MPRSPQLVLFAALTGAALAAGIACSGSGGTARTSPTAVSGTPGAAVTADTRSRPAGVPGGAEQVVTATQYGDPGGSGNEKLAAMSCAADVLTITTSARIVYAELPCDRMLKPENVKTFEDKPVRLRIVPQSASKLYIESQSAGSAEFTVGRVWIASR